MAVSASGFPLSGCGEQELPIQDRHDSKGGCAGMSQEVRQLFAVKGVQQSMANRLMQSSKIVEENLSCRRQLILSGLMKLFTIKSREVGMRLYTSHDEASVLRERPDRLS